MAKFISILNVGTHWILSFLFPTEKSVEKIEISSGDELTKILPRGKTPALFSYQDERVKHLIWEIKYYRNQKIIDTVGILIAEKIKNFCSDQTKQFFLVPIPLTARRLRERGFNHTEMLAQAIIKNLPENFKLASHFLKKVRHTPKQSSIEDRSQRFQNISGAFEVPLKTSDLHQILEKNIIIIDDVFTTGATIAEAKRALLKAGAKSIEVFVVAH